MIKSELNCLQCNCSMSELSKYTKGKTERRFCSLSCSASYTGHHYPRRKAADPHYCIKCGNRTRGMQDQCGKCIANTKFQRRVEKWLSGEWSGAKQQDCVLSSTIRRYLLDEADYSCSKCGFNINHPLDGKTILEINHIDGNGMNHRPENLEVLCPNCHALTDSYRGRNIGKGRPWVYKRLSD